MKLLGLSIQGLRSFVGDHVFHFPTGRGIYFVGGDNRAQPELGPNGCGKSAIWDVLCWVIYGKSTRGQIAGDVANWTREYASIGALDFEIRGVSYSITRTWDPNSLTLQIETDDPHVVDQTTITELVGMSYELFLATVVLSQFGTPFLQLGKAKKLEWFSTVLGLDVWTDKSEAAKKTAGASKVKRDACSKEITEFDAELETLTRNRAAEQQRADAWRDTNARDLASASDWHRRAKDAHELARTAVESKQARRLDSIDDLREVEQVHAAAVRRVEQHTELAFECQAELDRLRMQVDDNVDAQAELLSLNDTLCCPTCRQRVAPDHVASAVEAIGFRSCELEAQIAPVAADLERHRGAVCREHNTALELATGIGTRRRQLGALDHEIHQLTQRESGASRDLHDAAQREEALAQTTSPHADALASMDAELVQARADRDAAQADHHAHARAHDTAFALCDYFKDARLWIAEAAMGEFASVMSGTLEQLGLVGWQVMCDLEKPNKTGKKTQRGFQVLIKSPKSPDWVPWESWCGGETQRLSLAGSVAFSDLACSRMGVSVSAEVWDEPTQHLSPEGVADLLAYLHTRARRLGRQLFLVDHRSIGAGEFAGTYTVIMDDNGSRIESDQTRSVERCDQVLSKGSGRRRFKELQPTAPT